MVNKLDLSLDDIIKMNRGFRSNRGRGRGRGRSNATRGRVNSNRGRVISGGRVNTNRGQGFNNRRGFRRQRNRGQTSSNRGTGISSQRQKFVQNARFGGGDTSSGSGGIAKLLISNLDYGVTDADIKELFAEFGPIRKAAVHYDKSGQSLGTAEVVFERRFDAARAMRKYNGVPLDGRQMKIQITTSVLPQLSQSPQSRRGNFSGRGRFQSRGRRNFNQM